MAKPLLPTYKTLEGMIIMPGIDDECFRSALNYKAKSGDLFLVSYPKCGTTWLQTIVYLICNDGQPAATAPEFFNKMPFLEVYGAESVENKDIYSMKTHLPFDRIPMSKEAKYIYITRNPKDAVISFFHHTTTPAYIFEDGEFDVYFDLFMDGKVDYEDFFDHALGWYAHRQDKNILFLTYEELKADPTGTIRKIARFMGENFARKIEEDAELLKNVLKYSSMDEMKKIFNKGIEDTLGDMNFTEADVDAMPIPKGLKTYRKFVLKHRRPDSKHVMLVRKGQVGGWKNVLKKEQVERMDKRMDEDLKGTELYELWNNV